MTFIEADRYVAFIKTNFLTDLGIKPDGKLSREKMLLPETGVIPKEGNVINLDNKSYKLLEKSNQVF